MSTKSIASVVTSNTSVQGDVCPEHVIHMEHVMAIRRHGLQGVDALRIANLFSMLSDPTRVQVLHALLSAPTGELCVCDLAAGLGRDDTTISHQLRGLRQQKVVALRKVGRVVYYRLVDGHIRQLLRMGIDHVNEESSNGSLQKNEVLG